MAVTEQVHFRLLQTPCCGSLLCWVNPRLPTHCSECGATVYPAIKSCVLHEDMKALLKTTEPVIGSVIQKGIQE